MTIYCQMMQKLTKGDALFTIMKELSKDVQAGGSLGSSDYEMMVFRILEEENKTKSRIATGGFNRVDIYLFRDLLRRILCDTVLEEEWLRRVY